MFDDSHPDAKIEEYAVYRPGHGGFVIVKKLGLSGPDGPIYGLPEHWLDAPERAGVFATRSEAERVLAGKLH